MKSAHLGGLDSRNIKNGLNYITGGSGGSKGADKRATAFLSGIPLVGDVIRMVDNDAYWSDYLDNHGLTWADVKYPSRLGYASYGSAYHFVSRNIEKLYDNGKKPGVRGRRR